jgi:hypothetical protein
MSISYSNSLQQSYIASYHVTNPFDCIRIKDIVKQMIDHGEKIIDHRVGRGGYEILIERLCDPGSKSVNQYNVVRVNAKSGTIGLAFSG